MQVRVTSLLFLTFVTPLLGASCGQLLFDRNESIYKSKDGVNLK